MCSMEERDRCEVASQLDQLSERFGALEGRVHKLMSRLDSHDRIVRWVRYGALVLLGVGLGAGIIDPLLLSKLIH